MKWLRFYRADCARYRALRPNTPMFVIFLTEQGLWALLHYRLAAGLHRARLPNFLKVPLLGIMVLWQIVIEIVTKISLPYRADIGPGLHIAHFGPIILNPDTIMGANCNIGSGVIIGISGSGEQRGVPVIGNRVFIGPHTVIVGKITVGDDAVIGAGAIVVRSVRSHVTVAGNPAKEVSENGSEGYVVIAGQSTHMYTLSGEDV